MNFHQHLYVLRVLVLTSLLALLGSVAGAVDVPNRNPAVEEQAMRHAREAIAQKNWARAAQLLEAHVKAYPEDADAHNLMGYTQRHLGQFDLSLSAYQRALAIDPKHLGAHEYMGMLMLTLGQRDRAVQLLRNLEQLCQTPCEPQLKLQRAIESSGSGQHGGARY
jgi:tetratricopeptide (TPR) repeat protein